MCVGGLVAGAQASATASAPLRSGFTRDASHFVIISNATYRRATPASASAAASAAASASSTTTASASGSTSSASSAHSNHKMEDEGAKPAAAPAPVPALSAEEQARLAEVRERLAPYTSESADWDATNSVPRMQFGIREEGAWSCLCGLC